MKFIKKTRSTFKTLVLPLKRNFLLADISCVGNASICANLITGIFDDATQRFSKIVVKAICLGMQKSCQLEKETSFYDIYLYS